MAHDEIKTRLNLVLQRIENYKYNGVRVDQDLTYLAESLKFILDQNEILLQAVDAYGGHDASALVSSFRHPCPPESF